MALSTDEAKLLTDALEPVKQHILAGGEIPYGKQYWTESWRLRLEAECASDETWEEHVDSMFRQFYEDLADLIEDGDTNLTSDPWMKGYDGANKRGQRPVSIEVHQGTFYKEFKKVKDSWEYTLYVLLVVQWD